MSTLEKFGILVILILVVIIGVVAVWGVGGNEGANPFEPARDGSVATAPPGGTTDLKPWPDAPPVPATADNGSKTGPVAPPAVVDPVTPPSVQPSPAPVGPSAMPEVGAVGGGTYTVKKGDSPFRIAKEVLGDGNRWPEIMKVNPGVSPKRLQIGQKLNIPSGVAVAKAPAAPSANPPVVSSFSPNPDDGPTGPAVKSPAAPAAAGEIVVEDGDTLTSLAAKYLGDGNKWKVLQAANPGVDPRRLHRGQKLNLPKAE